MGAAFESISFLKWKNRVGGLVVICMSNHEVQLGIFCDVYVKSRWNHFWSYLYLGERNGRRKTQNVASLPAIPLLESATIVICIANHCLSWIRAAFHHDNGIGS